MVSGAKRRCSPLAEKMERLESKLAKLMPEPDPRAEFAWTGSFGASDTGMPSIGRVPRMRRTYSLLGYGGNGITFSMLGAGIIKRLIFSGDHDPDPASILFAISGSR